MYLTYGKLVNPGSPTIPLANLALHVCSLLHSPSALCLIVLFRVSVEILVLLTKTYYAPGLH